MNWFSGIFKKKEKEVAKEEVVLDFVKLSSIVEENIDGKVKQFAPDLENYHSKIQSASNRLQEKLNLLAKAVRVEQVDFQLLKIAISHRDEAVRRLNLTLKEFRKPVDGNLEDFLEFHNSCALSLNAANARLAKSFSIFEQVFRQESALVMSEYKNLYKVLEDIGIGLKGKKNALDPLYETRRHVQTMNYILNGIENNNNLIRNLNSELESLKNRVNTIRNDLDAFTSGDQWRSYQNLLKENDSISGEIKVIESKIVEAVSSIERPLKKYVNMPDMQNRKVIEFYLKNPIEASIADKNQAALKGVLISIETLVHDGKLIIGEKKGKRILDHIEEIKNGSFEILANNYEILQKEKQVLENKIEIMAVEKVKESLEFELKKNQGNILDVEGRISKLTNVNLAGKNEIEITKQALENSAKTALNQQVRLDMPNIEVLIIQKPN